MDFKKIIRNIPNFPKPGILFRDITPVLKDSEAFHRVVTMISEEYMGKKIDIVVGPESRGFIMGPPVALELSAGFVPVRKKGKLPAEVRSYSYELEYGTDTLEMHADAIKPGDRVLIVDDLLATGGTALATAKLVEELGGVVAGLAFFVELTELQGRDKLSNNYDVFTIVKY